MMILRIFLFLCLPTFVPALSAETGKDTVGLLEIGDRPVSTGYMGNGVQFGLYEHCHGPESEWGRDYGMWMDSAMWEKTFRRLDYMRLSLARTMISSKNFSLAGRDGAGNPVFDPERNLPVAEKWLDYCDSRNITLLWEEWGTGDIAPVTDTLWSRAVIGYADYLIRSRGHSCIHYFVGINEPDGDWTQATRQGQYPVWATATENILREIGRRGLAGRLDIAAPDACPGITGTRFTESAVRQFYGRTALWNLHIYPFPDEIRSGSYEKKIHRWHTLMGTDRKLVLGEIGMKYRRGTPENAENIRRAKEDPMGKSDTARGANMFVYDFSYAIDIADLYIQCMRGGASGGCAWMVCDAMNSSPGQKMKRWGLWNIFGSKMGCPKDERPRPWFYTLSLLSRYFPRGCDILPVATGPVGVRAVAAVLGEEITVAAVNNSDTPQRIVLRKTGTAPCRMRLFRCSEDERPADREGFPLPVSLRRRNLSAGESFRLPPRSFLLLTSFDY